MRRIGGSSPRRLRWINQRILVLPTKSNFLTREINLAGVAGREEKFVGSGSVPLLDRRKTPYIVPDAERDFTSEKPLPKARHS